MTYVRELRDQSGGRLGVIEVSMRMADIFPEIYRSGDSSWACFVDENWNLYDCGKTAAACKWQSYRGLILFRAGIRDRKESQQSAVIDRKNVAIVLRKVDKLNGMFVTLTNLDDATGNMIKQQQRMLLEFAGFGLLLIVVVNLIVRGLLKEFYDVLCEMRQIDNGTTKIKGLLQRRRDAGNELWYQRNAGENSETERGKHQKGGSAERYGNPGNAEPD